MPYFTKKPVRVEARQYDGSWAGAVAIVQWITDLGGEAVCRDCPVGGTSVQIRTLEGVMDVSPKDWVIRGVADEFYPCKPDIFEATYQSC